MKIALYPHHHCLPFWHGPKQPTILFDPAMACWVTKSREDSPSGKKDIATLTLAKDHWVWPILMGLHALDLCALAHVSIHFDSETRRFKIPKRVWVQITTLPEACNAEGIPVVVERGNVLVKHLWGGDNKTYTPYDLAGIETDERPSEFWMEFFHEKLKEAKNEAQEKADAAVRDLSTSLAPWAFVL